MSASAGSALLVAIVLASLAASHFKTNTFDRSEQTKGVECHAEIVGHDIVLCFENETGKYQALCFWRYAYVIDAFGATGQKLTDEEAHLESVQLIIASDRDWVVLPAGSTLRLKTHAFHANGALREIDAVHRLVARTSRTGTPKAPQWTKEPGIASMPITFREWHRDKPRS